MTQGPFALVRNPIFTAMIAAPVGLAIMGPNLVAVAAALSLLSAVQVRPAPLKSPISLRISASTPVWAEHGESGTNAQRG